jgi:hypothetical protein
MDLDAPNFLGETGFCRLIAEIETEQRGEEDVNRRRTWITETETATAKHALLTIREKNNGTFKVPIGTEH